MYRGPPSRTVAVPSVRQTSLFDAKPGVTKLCRQTCLGVRSVTGSPTVNRGVGVGVAAGREGPALGVTSGGAVAVVEGDCVVGTSAVADGDAARGGDWATTAGASGGCTTPGDLPEANTTMSAPTATVPPISTIVPRTLKRFAMVRCPPDPMNSHPRRSQRPHDTIPRHHRHSYARASPLDQPSAPSHRRKRRKAPAFRRKHRHTAPYNARGRPRGFEAIHQGEKMIGSAALAHRIASLNERRLHSSPCIRRPASFASWGQVCTFGSNLLECSGRDGAAGSRAGSRLLSRSKDGGYRGCPHHPTADFRRCRTERPSKARRFEAELR